MRMRTPTRAGLLALLECLEVRTAPEHRIKLRFGNLKRLPQDYQGERHVVISKHLPNRGDQEWCEFEEVAGPDPNPPQRPARGLPIHLDIVLVEAYPWREGAAAV